MPTDSSCFPHACAVGRNILPAIVLVLLTGCHTYGSSETIKPLPGDLIKASSISDIEIKALPPDASPDFRDKLNTALLTETKKCATGAHPLKLSVSIGRLTGQNVALTLLVGDSEDIKGSAQLIEPASGTVVGDYDINKSVGGGGVIAAVGMAGGEAKLADAFASEICKQAFGQ
jgi:hypothetical protein